MLSLRSFFESVEKPVLREVYAKTFGHGGLINNTLLLKDLPAFYGNAERLLKLAGAWNSWQLRLVKLVVRSGARGLSFGELRLAVPVGNTSELMKFLSECTREFVLWKTKGEAENVVYRAFEETSRLLLGERPAPFKVQGLQKISYGTRLDFHLCRLLALLKLGRLKVNSSNELQHRSEQICEAVFAASKAVSPKLAQDELELLLQFFTHEQWLLRNSEAELLLSKDALDFLNKNGFRLHQEFCSWWLESRFKSLGRNLALVLDQVKEPVSIQFAIDALWPFDPGVRLPAECASCAVQKLPRVLRELWLLGVLDFFGNRNGEIFAVEVNALGRELMQKPATASSAEVSTLANFESIVPADTAPRVLFYACCFAKPENDEPYLRFKFEREKFLEALHSGFSELEVGLFLSWMRPPQNVSDALGEWAASFFGSSIFDARVLKVQGGDIREELSRFPQFMSFVLETIPGYGFLIRREGEAKVREILQNYGLTPAEDNSGERIEVLEKAAWSRSFELPWPAETAPDYALREESTVEKALAKGRDEFGDEFFRPDTKSLVKALRYAKSTGTLFTARIFDLKKKRTPPQERTFFVRKLLLGETPLHASVQEFGSKELEDLDLSIVYEMRLLHKAEA